MWHSRESYNEKKIVITQAKRFRAVVRPQRRSNHVHGVLHDEMEKRRDWQNETARVDSSPRPGMCFGSKAFERCSMLFNVVSAFSVGILN